jgi:hypothetical protein
MSAVWCLVFSLLTSMMLAQHIKSFVLLPAVALAGFLVIRRALPFVLFAGASLFSFYETYSVWAKRTDCPELPLLQEAFHNLSLSPHLLMTSPLSFLSTAIHNTAGYWVYIINGFFAYSYLAQWLPIDEHSALIENFSNLLLVLAVVFLVGISVWSAYKVVRTSDTWAQRLQSPAILGLVIVLGLFLLLPYQSTKNFYETALFWPLLLLACALSAGQLVPLGRRLPRAVIAATLVAVIVSQATLVVVLQSYQSGWEQRRASEAVALADVREIGQACGLRQDQTQAGLVVSNIAHQVYWKTFRPVLADYVIGQWGLGLNLKAAAKDWPIQAIVAECRTIPADLLPQSKRSADGLYCCAQL